MIYDNKILPSTNSLGPVYQHTWHIILAEFMTAIIAQMLEHDAI
jgi:hypothetical protein